MRAGKGRGGREGKLWLSSSSGTSARGTRGRARDRRWDSGGEGRALRASSAAAHGSGRSSWATPGPGKGTAAISVPGHLLPPRITLPDSSVPPSALSSGNRRSFGAPSSSGAFFPSPAESRVAEADGRALLALRGPSVLCGQPWVVVVVMVVGRVVGGPITPRLVRPGSPIPCGRCSASRLSGLAARTLGSPASYSAAPARPRAAEATALRRARPGVPARAVSLGRGCLAAPG